MGTSHRLASAVAGTLGLALLLLAAPAWSAQVVKVRVGEHPTYTRIVFELDAPAGYGIERRTGDQGSEILVTLEARAANRRLSRTTDMIRGIDLKGVGSRAMARIKLRKPPSRVKEMILANPPRIVFDLVLPEKELAAKEAAKKRRASAAAKPKVAKPAAAKPAARVEKPAPKPEPVAKAVAKATAPAPKPEPVAKATPSAPKPAARVEKPAPKPEPVAKATPPPAPVVEATPPKPPAPAPKPVVEAARPVGKPPAARQSASSAVPVPKPEPLKPEIDAELPIPAPGGPKPGSANPKLAAASPEPGSEPLRPEKPKPEAAPVPTPKPRPAVRPATPPMKSAEPEPVAPAAGGGIDFVLWGGVAAGVLVVLIGVALVLRRRKLPNDSDVTAVAEDGDGDGPIPAGGFSMDTSPAESPGPLFDDVSSGGAGPAESSPTVEMDIAAGPGLFDEEETEKESETMDLDSPNLPVDSEMPTQVGAAGGGDVANLVRDLERRMAQLETRLDEATEARERLERQVAAQAEELRVQRAAIARTQRALRSLNRPAEEQATEPALRDQS